VIRGSRIVNGELHTAEGLRSTAHDPRAKVHEPRAKVHEPRAKVHEPRVCYSEINKESCAMHISSPFVVVPVILAVFVVSILFSNSSKEDKPSTH
jgi:hypothetical protein